MKKYFIKGSDVEILSYEKLHNESRLVLGALHVNGAITRIPVELVEEREVPDPEPPLYTILLLKARDMTVDRPSIYTAVQRRGIGAYDRWYKSDAGSSGMDWKYLNDNWEIVQTIRSVAQ